MHANHMQGLQLSSNPCTIPTAFPTPSTPTAPRSSPPPSSAHISSSAARPCSRPRRRYPYHNQKRPRLMISSSHGVGVFQGKKITKTKPRKRARKRRPPLLVVKGGNLPPLKQQIRSLESLAYPKHARHERELFELEIAGWGTLQTPSPHSISCFLHKYPPASSSIVSSSQVSLSSSKSHLLSLLLLPFSYSGFPWPLSLSLSLGREERVPSEVAGKLPLFAISHSSLLLFFRKGYCFLLPGFLSMCVAMAIVFLPPHQILDSRTMGDHLALLVDHLLTESTLEAAIGNGKQAQIAADSASSGDLGNNSTPDTSVGRRTPSGKLVECRICQEDDQDSNMEIPCSCCGSLKYAHRVCIQRWCNEKGNTMCEICLQQFKPGYTALPKLFHYGRAPMNFRGSWDTSSQDLHDPQILTVVPSGVIESNYYDHLASRLRSTICCRSVTIIFMILLVLRHTLPLIKGGAEQYSFTLFSVKL
ncbi:hypothetical protein MUK42_34286 [Musa troglodytarum]|uniref:RING-CH-type domain-containing protein n=1 Tax=Musa troglodytarum TaxID=320322 RepID=A0A9E7F580_9LILI|nr:hypothetical protein MUK42_34286 [Musa troglodytarum]